MKPVGASENVKSYVSLNYTVFLTAVCNRFEPFIPHLSLDYDGA